MFLKMKIIYCVLIQLFLNCTLCLKNDTEDESLVTSTGYTTQTQEYIDDQKTTFSKSNILNTVLSLIQNDTLPDNEWRNIFSATSSLFYTTNLGTTTKSSPTDIYLGETLQNVSIEGTTIPTPIYPCSAEGNCNFTKYMKHQFCHCDPDCYIYKDCCFDSKKPANTSNSVYSSYYTCHKGHNYPIDEGFFVVDSCPTGYGNEADSRICKEHKISENGPSVVNPEGVVFKNRHCALCHGVSDVESFDVMFNVSDKLSDILLSKLTNLSKFEKIELMMSYFSFKEMPPKDFVPRSCIPQTIKQNNSLCQFYINPVYYRKRGDIFMYRNYFCTPEPIRHLTKCVGVIYDELNEGRIKFHPLSVMFSFNKATKNDRKETCDYWSKEVEETNACPEKERYSNFQISMSNFKFVSNKTLTLAEVFMIVKILATSMEISNFSALVKDVIFVGHVNTSVIFIVDMSIELQPTMFAQEVKQYNEIFKGIKWRLRITGVAAWNGIEVRREALEVIEGQNIYQAYENETGVRVNKMLRILNSQLDQDAPQLVKICEDIIVLAVRSNTSLINMTSIECNDAVSLPVSDNSFIRVIITHVCFSVSMVSLLVLIVVYRKIGMTSTIPGSNLENISVSLYLSNCLFMLGVGASDIREVCFVIGVILHHLWLSVFYFMSMATLCIVKNLTKLRSSGQNNHSTLKDKKRCLALGGIIAPCMFVGPAVFLDLYGDTYLSSGYGKQPCFPHIFPANLIFFSGPVLLSITINFICLLRVIGHICILSHEIGNISMSTPFTHAKVYLRILALSGFFWITGIMAAILESDWLDYIFTLLCGLQGFFVAVASLTTRQVVRKFKYKKEHVTQKLSDSKREGQQTHITSR